MRLGTFCIVAGFSLAAGCYARADEQAPRSGGNPAAASGIDEALLAWDDDAPAPDVGPPDAPPRPDRPHPGEVTPPPPRRGDRERPRRPEPSEEGDFERGPRPDQPLRDPPPTFLEPDGGRFGPGAPGKGGPGRFGGKGDMRPGMGGVGRGMRMGDMGMGGMGRGMGMRPDDPEMMKLDQADAEAENATRQLAEKYRHTTSEEDKKKLREALAEVVEKHFQVRQERRELELKRLERQLNHLREVIAKRTEAKQTIIKNRMNQVLGEPDELGF